MPDHLSAFDWMTVGSAIDFVRQGSAPIVAAWAAGAILNGDRSHGAGSLMGSIAVTGSSRVLAKAVAIVGSTLLPLGVALLIAAVGASLHGGSPMDPSDFNILVLPSLAATMLVVGFVLAAAPLSRAIRTTLAWAVVFGVATIAVAALGHLLASTLALADHHAAGARFKPGSSDLIAHSRRIATIEGHALAVATVCGAAVGALVGAGTGLWAIARPRHLRKVLTAHGIMLTAALVGGSLASWVAIEREIRSLPEHYRSMITMMRATEAELIASIKRYRTRDFVPIPAMPADVEEARRRILVLDEPEQATHPLNQALLAAHDRSTAERWLTTMEWPFQPEAAVLVSVMDAALAFPEHGRLRQILRWKLLDLSLWGRGSLGGRELVVSGEKRIAWPLIASITPTSAGAADQPAFGSPLWALEFRDHRWMALHRELMRHLRESDPNARDRSAARVEEIERELDDMNRAESNPAQEQAALVSRITNSRHMDGPDCAWRRRRNSAYHPG